MIELKHSSTVIHNYTLGDCQKLERILSVWDGGSFKHTWRSFLYNEEKHTLTIPRGFDPEYLTYIFPDKRLKVNSKADPSKMAIINLKVEPRDDLQRDAIKFLIGSGSYKNLAGETQRMLCMKTGAGKTYCAINYLTQLRKRAIVIVDQDKIMSQWKDEMLNYTNLHDKDIYIISGAASINKILKHSGDFPHKVYIASHRTLASYAKDDWSVITELFSKLHLGVKLYDEAHVEYKNIFMIDSYTNTANTLYLTATPGRSNPSEDGVFQNSFKTVPKFGLEEKFDDPYMTTCYVSYDSKPDSKIRASFKTRRGFDINKFSDYCFNEAYDTFLDTIKQLLDITTKKKGKTAVIIHKLEHVKLLKEALEKRYPNEEVGMFCTLIPKKADREAELDKHIIISTDKSFGKALNVPGLQFLISTVPTSSKVVADQLSGRLREIPGKTVMFFDLTDVGFPDCRNQRTYRRRVLDMKSAVIKSLKL